MSDRIEKLIRKAAPPLADPTEYRRLNRVALRERLYRMEHRPRRHTLVLVVSCLVLMMVFSGQINELGGDDWEMDLVGTEDQYGSEVKVYQDKFSGRSWVVNLTPDEVIELDQTYQAQEGKLSRLTRLAYQGKECWGLYRTITKEDGSEQQIRTIAPEGLDCAELPNDSFFYPTYFRDLRTRSRLTAPDRIFFMRVFDVEFKVSTWTHTYPKFGEVSYSVGYPVE